MVFLFSHIEQTLFFYFYFSYFTYCTLKKDLSENQILYYCYHYCIVFPHHCFYFKLHNFSAKQIFYFKDMKCYINFRFFLRNLSPIFLSHCCKIVSFFSFLRFFSLSIAFALLYIIRQNSISLVTIKCKLNTWFKAKPCKTKRNLLA